MHSNLMYKLLKYFLEGIVIYSLFKYIPREPMVDKDILSITIVVVLVYAVLENLYSLYFKHDVPVCSLPVKPEQEKEPMGNVSNNVNVSELSSQISQLSASVSQLKDNLQTMQVQNMNNNLNPTPQVSPPVSTVNGMTVNQNGQYTITPDRNPQASQIGSRAQDDVMKNETQYSYIDLNTLPNVSPLNTGSFESGYSFLPPAQWFPVPPHPPVCVAEKQCPVCPVFDNGTVDLKEWDSSRRISPPDQMNVKAIEEKLNSGR